MKLKPNTLALLTVVAGITAGAILPQQTPHPAPSLGKAATSTTSVPPAPPPPPPVLVLPTSPETYTCANGITVDIQGFSPINGGYETYAQAWQGTKAVGFGKDNTTETEHFRFLGMGTTSYPDALCRTMAVVGRTDTLIVKGSIGHTTDTFFPSSDDSDFASSGTFSVARGATTGTLRGAAGGVVQGTISGGTYFVERYFSNFDTSALPDGDTVSSATLSIVSQGGVTGTSDYGVYGSTASDTIVAGDFDLVDTTANSDLQSTTAGSPAAMTFTLNATGLAAISKTGLTKFSVRNKTKDVDNVAPVDVQSYNFFTVEDGTPSNRPTLVVVHAGDTFQLWPLSLF